MAIPRYVQKWFDALPEEEKRATMERLSKNLEEECRELIQRRKNKST